MAPTQNTALKMADPTEICAQSKKLMVFCKTEARSIKAMRQHLGVTHQRINTLLGDMLAKNLLCRQHNTLFTTEVVLQGGTNADTNLQVLCKEHHDDKMLGESMHGRGTAWQGLGSVTDSMAALVELSDSSNKGILTAEEASELASAHEELNINTHIDQADITELDLALEDSRPLFIGIDLASDPDYSTQFTANEFAPKPYDLDAMASEFEAEQERGDQHNIDNLDAKQRVLNYCQMLLSPTSTEMRRCLDELQMDLAVIRLHQERSA